MPLDYNRLARIIEEYYGTYVIKVTPLGAEVSIEYDEITLSDIKHLLKVYERLSKELNHKVTLILKPYKGEEEVLVLAIFKVTK